jgi:hypothetical protein
MLRGDKLRNVRGAAIEGGLITLVVVSTFVSLLLVLKRYIDESTFRRVRKAEIQHIATNAANIAVLFHRKVSYNYFFWAGARTLTAPTECPAPKSFLQILSFGTDCADSSYRVFDKYTGAYEDSNTEIPGGKNIYSYTGNSCAVGRSGSDCGARGLSKLVVTVGFDNEAQKISGHSINYYLLGFDAIRLTASYLVEIFSPNGNVQKHYLTIGDDTNMIFSQVNSSLVTNFAKSDTSCPTTLWGDFYYFNSDPSVLSCVRPPLIGSLDGLANNRGNLIGFRRPDGDLFDMGSGGNFIKGPGRAGIVPSVTTSGAGTYASIEENGRLEGESGRLILFPFERKHLANANDIEIIPKGVTGGQIFYIKGEGLDAHIGLLNMDQAPDAEKRSFPVCSLGLLGLPLAFEALGVSTSSDYLITTAEEAAKFRADKSTLRLATFFLKTTSGDFYRAYVVQNLMGVNHLSYANHDDRTVLQCFVVRDEGESAWKEYGRVYSGTTVNAKRNWSMN